ncbi:AgrD family cyclic lactone autoinducer peptide [Clostridium cibarium]|uniref:Cyclic lactone autoinducer peptide n=1 Tax=Clostridium cibarium TaxID=2762247 RepID=A0ABR8PPQ8_9CLOT|nr:cyclic lactone autoinducer peptide [Clostridium cibarium]MBD7910148.1 cyclic lactone autoinducer peptide [Clostridium cibarium]
MKSFKFKKSMALLISAIAMLAATTSSSLCFWLFFEEPKMPKSLYKVE